MGQGDIDHQNSVPILDFSSFDDDDELSRENVVRKVREACERHGCFIILYDKISKELREDMFVAMKSLFDLPEEIKNKYQSPKPYRSYSGKCPIIPLHESFGIDDAPRLTSAQAFTTLMWPQGNPSFCETVQKMGSKMEDLNIKILKMIYESFGMEGEQCESQIKDMSSTNVFRVMKYNVPPRTDGDASGLGLLAHTDKNALTILCQNEVQGLEILNNDGDWVQVVMPPQNSYIVIVGDALKAWSNGRLVAVKHRVVMKGDKERYSCGLFSIPKEGATIEVPKQFVDKEHPLLYKPFKFSDYFSYFVSNISDDALEVYAGA
ncbi:probable 2-oxoglutarate-dependent dioxygenase AOP1 [Rutidosis leptorrhynchoides]|uniref:probable 2-oxoglutarate-dependent dioxygenase AOP1 n=1 Tax=Rutidosis leptorrhynchoides TaxID=125765 RepID=UPI003A993176